MRLVCHVLLASVACLALCGCQTVKKSADAEQVLTYSDWTPNHRTLKNGNVLHLADTMTTPAGEGQQPYLLFTYVGLDCAPRGAAIFMKLEKPVEKTFTSGLLTGEVRVDELPPFPVTYDYDMKKGGESVDFTFDKFFENKELLAQLLKGQTVRFKLTAEKREYVLRFTLRNHVRAMSKVVDDCKDAASFKPKGQSKPAPAPAAGPAANTSNNPPGNPMPSPAKNGDEDKKFFQ